MKKKVLLWVLSIILIIILSIFLIRIFSARQIDDISPEISCEKELIAKSDILYVIPKFQNKSIAENRSWCNYILSLNKTLGLHGVYHTFNEFLTDRTPEYLEEGIKIFYDCFGFYPERFEPPQVAISNKNKFLIKEKMKLDLYAHNLFHKVYHCEDTGIISNKNIDLF